MIHWYKVFKSTHWQLLVLPNTLLNIDSPINGHSAEHQHLLAKSGMCAKSKGWYNRWYLSEVSTEIGFPAPPVQLILVQALSTGVTEAWALSKGSDVKKKTVKFAVLIEAPYP